MRYQGIMGQIYSQKSDSQLQCPKKEHMIIMKLTLSDLNRYGYVKENHQIHGLDIKSREGNYNCLMVKIRMEKYEGPDPTYIGGLFDKYLSHIHYYRRLPAHNTYPVKWNTYHSMVTRSIRIALDATEIEHYIE